MAVVTVSRDFGSSGKAIAQRAAKLLGYHFADKESIGRILAGYGLIEFEEKYEEMGGILSILDSRRRMVLSMLDRATRSLARHGNIVILGRGSFVVLSGFVDVLNVRIQAPFESRVARLMGEEGMSDRREAAEAVRRGDLLRSSFLSSIYGVRWDEAERFDLVVNAARISLESTAEWIAAAAGDLASRTPSGRVGTEDVRRTADLPADPVLDEAVAAELGCAARHEG